MILRAMRRDFVAHVARPDHLVGAGLDVFALEEIGAVLVAGEVEHAIAPRLERLRDREQHGVAETAAGEQHRRFFWNLGRGAGGSHHDHGLARLEIRAQPARHAHFERDQRQQALLGIHPRAGQRDAFHQHRRDVIVDAHVRAEALEVLQAIELAGMEMPRRRGRAHDHFDDRRRQAHDLFDAREQLVVQLRDQRLPRRFALRLLRRIERRNVIVEQRDDVRVAVLRRRHRLDDVAVVARMVVAVVGDEFSVGVVRREEAVGIGL